MKHSSVDELCKPLNPEITKQLKEPGNVVLDLLKKSMPSSDINRISDELKKVYIFDKIKSNNPRKIIKPKKNKYLSAKQRKLLGLKCPGSGKNIKYENVLELNKLWLEYIQQTLGCQSFSSLPPSPEHSRWDAVGQKLMKADLHGAKITVIRSKCPSLVGLRGIILQDTKNTFQIISKDDTIRTISKPIVVIKIHLIGAALELFGKELCFRPAERTAKKFKANHHPEL